MVGFAGRVGGDLAQEQRLIAPVALPTEILSSADHALLEIGLAQSGRDVECGRRGRRTQRLAHLLHCQHPVEELRIFAGLAVVLRRHVTLIGDFRRAAAMFGALAETYAGGALTAEALFLRGAALDSAGDTKGAAAAWLEGFAAAPDGPRAAESLLGLARVIADDGDPTAACLYLAEIPARFPGTPPAAEAETRLSRLACSSNDLGMAAEDATDPEVEADLAEPR